MRRSEAEAAEARCACVFCGAPGPETELACAACGSCIPFCIATGARPERSHKHCRAPSAGL
jgi:hypothetical protein